MKLSRRQFVSTVPFALAAILGFDKAGFAQSAARMLLPQRAVPDALSQLSWSSFLPYINTDFTFGMGGNAVTLRLLSMDDLRPVGTKPRAGQECFMMKFQGPYAQPLNQGTYSVNHFLLGDFDLFITNGGRVRKNQYYVAIINRMAS